MSHNVDSLTFVFFISVRFLLLYKVTYNILKKQAFLVIYFDSK